MKQQELALVRGLIISLILIASAQAQILQGVLGSSGSTVVPSWGTPTHFVASTASGTTSAVPSVTIPAGALVVIWTRVLAAVTITGTDVAGTTTDCGIRAGTQATRSMVLCAYILSATAVNNATVTVNFSGTNGGSRTDIRVYPYSNGTPAIDAINDESANAGQSGTTFTGPATMTLTGSSDIVTEAASAFDSGGSSHNVTAVDGSWTRTDFSAAGFADQKGVTSITVPTWTTTSSFTIKATGAIAFGFSPTTGVDYGMEDFSGGTAGNNFLNADLETGLKGVAGNSNPLVAGGVPQNFTVTDPATSELTYCTAAHHSLNGAAPRFHFGGTTYSDAGTLGACFNTTGTGVVRSLVLNVPWETIATGLGVNTVQTSVVFFKTDLTSANTVNSVINQIHTPSSSEFCAMILHATAGVLRFELEGSASSPVTISSNTWYQISCKSDSSSGATAQIWSEDGSTQIGSDMTLTYTTTGTAAAADNFGIGLIDGSTVTTAHNMYWDKWKICYNAGATCPWPMKN